MRYTGQGIRNGSLPFFYPPTHREDDTVRIAIPATVETKLFEISAVTYEWFLEGVTTGRPVMANDGTSLLELEPPPPIDRLVAMSLLVHRWKWGTAMPVYRLGRKGWVRWNVRSAVGDPSPSSTLANPTEIGT